MRTIGQPARAAGLVRLLDYLKGLGDIWLCSRIDIARHWIAQHPFVAGVDRVL
jgi:allantoinase